MAILGESYFSVERMSNHSKDRDIKMHTLPFLGIQLQMGFQLCVLSFSLLRLSRMSGYSVYPFAEWVGDENNLLANSGKKESTHKDHCAHLMESTYLFTVVPLKMEV